VRTGGPPAGAARRSKFAKPIPSAPSRGFAPDRWLERMPQSIPSGHEGSEVPEPIGEWLKGHLDVDLRHCSGFSCWGGLALALPLRTKGNAHTFTNPRTRLARRPQGIGPAKGVVRLLRRLQQPSHAGKEIDQFRGLRNQNIERPRNGAAHRGKRQGAHSAVGGAGGDQDPTFLCRPATA
jgi:hypothetical protein